MTSILIWDAPLAELSINLSSKFDSVYLWSDYIDADYDKFFSVPLLLEKNRDYCRDQYLDLLRSIASFKILNQDLPGLYQYSPSTSLWWSSLTHESCFFDKSPLSLNSFIRSLSIPILKHIIKSYLPLPYSNCQYLKESVITILPLQILDLGD